MAQYWLEQARLAEMVASDRGRGGEPIEKGR